MVCEERSVEKMRKKCHRIREKGACADEKLMIVVCVRMA